MSHDNFQPPEYGDEPEDDKWERWFAQQEKNGYAVISRDEWMAKLDDAAKDGYAEGRKDQYADDKVVIDELLGALRNLHERLSQCANFPVTAAEAYDSFYRELVDEAIAKATAVRAHEGQSS